MKKAIMSHEQKRMWFYNQMLMQSDSGELDVYNVVLGVEICGRLEVEILLQSFEAIVARHESLRTTFEMNGEQPMQIVYDVDENINRNDWYYEYGADVTYQECINDFYKSRFDLSHMPLYKFGIVKAAPDKNYMIICIHHTLFDGWSSELLFRELFEGYTKLRHGLSIDCEPLKYQYFEYTENKQKKIDKELEKYKDFWVSHLEGVETENDFPNDFERVSIQNGPAGYVDFRIEGNLQKDINRFCAQNRVSVYNFMISCYAAVLARYKQSDAVTIGVTLLGRAYEYRETIGNFINTMPVRFHSHESENFVDYMKSNMEIMRKAMVNQNYPFDMLVNDMNVDRSSKKNPFFSCSIQYNTWGTDRDVVDSGNEVEGLVINSITYRNPTALLDMDLELFQKGQFIDGYLQYDKKLIKEETAESFVECFLSYIEQVICDQQYDMKTISCISAHDRYIQEKVINKKIDFTRPKNTIIDLYLDSVVNVPNDIALRCDGQEMTYAELDVLVNRMANYYEGIGIKKGNKILVQMKYSFHMVSSVLALVKIGATYIPVDVTYPLERINLIIDEAEVCACIVDNDKMENGEVDCITINTCTVIDQILLCSTVYENCSSLDDIVYIIYTSGSTGKPKGVKVAHYNLYNYLVTAKKEYCQNAKEGFALFGSFACDFVCTALYTPLISGGTLNLFNDDKEKYILKRVVEDDNVTIIKITPSHLIILNNLDIEKTNVHTIILGGENLITTTAANAVKKFPNKIRIANEYGPTEATVATMIHWYDIDTDNWGAVPIGVALSNNGVWVLGKNLELLPNGVLGELYISGVQVTQGYLNNDEMTSERFINHKELGRIYKTGDIVVIKEGLVHYLGRNDDQVKINGFRIELNEVNESISKLYSDVNHVCTVVKKGNRFENVLVVFYDGNFNESLDEIKLKLGQQMPHYMVPSIFVKLDDFPMLANGKINRKEIEKHPLVIDNEVGVENEELTATEAVLKEIWENGLKNGAAISKATNFFNVGGHSILAIHIINQIKKYFNIEVTLEKVFENPVLEDLAKYIEHKKTEGISIQWKNICHYKEQERYELAPVQKPEWYLYELAPDNSFYTSSSTFILNGDLDIEAMEKTVDYLFRTNRLLRIGFTVDDGKPYQFVREFDEKLHSLFYHGTETIVDSLDQKEILIKSVESVSNYVFNLYEDTLFRFHLFKIEEKKYLFSLVTHHIVWDEVSNLNLIEQIAKVYNQYLTKGKVEEKNLEIVDYFDYCKWMNEMIADGTLEMNKQYWEEKYLSNIPEMVDLPVDNIRPSVQTFCGNTLYYRIEKEVEEEIRKYCKNKNITENVFFVSLLFLLYHKLTGADDLVIGTPMVNRDVAELEKMLGSFACGIPLRCGISEQLSVSELLYQIKDEITQDYDNHMYPFNYILEGMRLGNDSSRGKLFSIMYGMQNDKLALKSGQLLNGIDLEFMDEGFVENAARFDLTFSIETINGFMLNVNYNTDLFLEKTMEMFIQRYMKLVADVLNDDKKTVGDLNIYLDYDREVFYKGCVGACAEIGERTFISLFHEYVRNNPDAVAIRNENHVETYLDIYEKSQYITSFLINHCSIHPEDRIGIKMEQDEMYIITVLAVLQAGATFVPMDYEYPENRINDIIEQASIKVVLTHNEEREGNIRWVNVSKVLSDGEYGQENYDYSAHDQVAYILFTSGSTGKPKGIEVEHRGIMNLFLWTKSQYPLYQNDETLFMTPLTFDVSILEYLYPFVCGACVRIIGNEQRGNPQYIGRLTKDNVVILQFVPDLLNAFIESYRNDEFDEPQKLKYVICAGGVLTKRLIDEFKEVFNCQLSNHYGPTEATVDTIYYEIGDSFEEENVPIGRPIDNTSIYILDQNRCQVPVGVRGELCIDSLSLARGYTGQPELTEKAFINWKDEKGETIRLYRTGDIGYLNHDGNICFVGRVDNQVKIRGNRIELEDIENTAKKIQQVRSSAVVFQNNQLELAVDLNNNNIVETKQGLAYIYSLEQMSYKMREIEQINTEAWPEYFEYNEATKNYWPALYTDFLDYQILLMDNKDELIGIGHTIPIRWDGTIQNIPKGWDGAIETGIASAGKDVDTLMVLAGIVPATQQGKGYSSTIIKAFKKLAAIHGLKRILVPVRPTKKYQKPFMDMEEYVTLKDENGKLFDPWIRTHLNLGGIILSCEQESQLVVAPIDQWKVWLGKDEISDVEIYEKCLSTIRFQTKEGTGIYYDPCVWIQHKVEVGDNTYESFITKDEIKNKLSNLLPSYMLPDRIEILHQLPRLINEKIDKNKLKSLLLGSYKSKNLLVKPATPTELAIAEIWRELMNCEVGVLDDFYEVGGYSLMATVLINRINNKYGINMSLKDLFVSPTVRGIAGRVEELLQNMETEKTELLAIKPVQCIENDCFEDQMFSIFQWLELDFRCLYANEWNFYWKDDGTSELTRQVGSGADVNSMLKTMQDLYGLDYSLKGFDSFDDSIPSIEEYLKNKRPVVILDNSFYCHWAPNYLQYSDNHCCIITGIDTEKKVLYVTDGYYSMFGVEYPFEEIRKGFNGFCLYIGVLTRDVELTVDELRRYFINCMKGREHIFSDMRQFADKIPELDWKSMKTNQNVVLCDVYKIFYQIKLKRMQLNRLLNYLCSGDDIINISNTINDLWEVILNLVIKLLMRPESDNLKAKVQTRLKEVSLAEEDLLKNFFSKFG